MTIRERILSVYRGDVPDVVPYMLDLSHYYYHANSIPWDLSKSLDEPDQGLIAYHKNVGAGFYMPNLASLFSVEYSGDVSARVEKKIENGRQSIVWRYSTPLGSLERVREWQERSYSWGIVDWPVKSVEDLRILAYALTRRSYKPLWDRYLAWVESVGDWGVVYMPVGYSAIGHLLNYWMGVENTVYASYDHPSVLRQVVDEIDANNLRLIDLVAQSPAEIVVMGDNISSDVQPPSFFNRWSRPYYAEAIKRLHAAGKFVAMHVDGKLRGALRMVCETGADCADAVTPGWANDLTATQCRDESGPGFILSGGVPPGLWLPGSSEAAFADSVMQWLDLRKRSPRLIAGAGDQVPPGAVAQRVEIMREMVEAHGSY